VTRRTLVVTNDFPPRRGGIQSFVHGLAARQPAGSIVVFASNFPGAAEFDAAQPFPVVRYSSGLMLPTPKVREQARSLVREHDCTAVWFGAAAPLGLLAPALREVGVERVVATTHGHEAGWAMLPIARSALRRIGAGADVVTYLGEYTRRRLEPVLGRHTQLRQLTPGVDVGRFQPGVSGDQIRWRHDLDGRPVVVCVSRLVPRKGQDALIRAWPQVLTQIPRAALLLVGSGPYEPALRRLAAKHHVSADVVFTGQVAEEELPAHYAAGDVFAMPCRTRRAGADVEGLGIVYLEASALGLPVIAGDSGGAPDAVLADRSGYVVDGRDPAVIARRVVSLLADPQLRADFGAAGRAWVERDWQWDTLALQLRVLLDGENEG
jgi:phosphatidylinositol alpha-1,6-mannosyltransferase